MGHAPRKMPGKEAVQVRLLDTVHLWPVYYRVPYTRRLTPRSGLAKDREPEGKSDVFDTNFGEKQSQ